MLHVFIHYAQKLPLASNGQYQPQVEVFLGADPNPLRTQAVQVPPGMPKDANPNFQVGFSFPIQWPINQYSPEILIRVIEHDASYEVVPIGELVFKVSDMFPGVRAHNVFPLQGGAGGDLCFTLVPPSGPLGHDEPFQKSGPYVLPQHEVVPPPFFQNQNPVHYSHSTSSLPQIQTHQPTPAHHLTYSGAANPVQSPPTHASHVRFNSDISGGSSNTHFQPQNAAPTVTNPTLVNKKNKPVVVPKLYAVAPVSKMAEPNLYEQDELEREYPNFASGSFGTVYKGRIIGKRAIAKRVVIKDQMADDEKKLAEFTREVDIMFNTRSPYIAEIFGWSKQPVGDGFYVTIVMEFFKFGDLFKVLHKEEDKHPLSLLQRIRMARQTCLGIQVLHDNGIIHRDIKSMNVLVTKDYSCKITDFGCSKLIASNSKKTQLKQTIVGSPLWMAPEVRKEDNFGYPADIYSLGVLLFEIFERKLPELKLEVNQALIFPETYRSKSIVSACVALDPMARPVIGQILNALDELIGYMMTQIYNSLPQGEQEWIQKQNPNLKPQSRDFYDAIYVHMGFKTPAEVDAQIATAYAVAKPKLFKLSAFGAPRPLRTYLLNDIKRDHPPIGKGGFGTIYKGNVPGVDFKVVIKDMSSDEDDNFNEWMKEIQIMHENRSPYIVELFGYCRTELKGNKSLSIVMEYMEKGDLYNVLHAKAAQHPLSTLQRLRMARHCGLGIQVLHEHHIMHRDIKSLNVLVTKDYSCKIADLGAGKLVDPSIRKSVLQKQTVIGSPVWMAPEVWKNLPYNFAADIYSIGVLLYEIFDRKFPDFDEELRMVQLPKTKYYGSAIVVSCLAPDPLVRPSINAIVNSIDSLLRTGLGKVYEILPASDKATIDQDGFAIYSEDHLDNIYGFLSLKTIAEVDALWTKAASAAPSEALKVAIRRGSSVQAASEQGQATHQKSNSNGTQSFQAQPPPQRPQTQQPQTQQPQTQQTYQGTGYPQPSSNYQGYPPVASQYPPQDTSYHGGNRDYTAPPRPTSSPHNSNPLNATGYGQQAQNPSTGYPSNSNYGSNPHPHQQPYPQAQYPQGQYPQQNQYPQGQYPYYPPTQM